MLQNIAMHLLKEPTITVSDGVGNNTLNTVGKTCATYSSIVQRLIVILLVYCQSVVYLPKEPTITVFSGVGRIEETDVGETYGP